MDSGKENDRRLADCRRNREENRSRETAQGKKCRQNPESPEADLGQGPGQSSGARPKHRAPGNLTSNGICPEPKMTNSSSSGTSKASENSDPYSVAYNVDSKILDKCLSSKIDRTERNSDTFLPNCCNWGLQDILANESQVKINNTEDFGEAFNGEPGHRAPLNVVNDLESRPVEVGESSGNGEVKNDFNINVPSTSNARSGRGGKGARKRRARGAAASREDSSSDTGNDDYSVGSDECCIYTYRGGEHLADLPSSFFSLDMGLAEGLPGPLFVPRVAPPPAPPLDRRSASSPDMDYLEMDFDPGPSCEADSDRESSLDLDLDADHSEENPPHVHSPQLGLAVAAGIDNIVQKADNSVLNSVVTVSSDSVGVTASPPSEVNVSLDVPGPSLATRFSPIPSTSGTVCGNVNQEVATVEAESRPEASVETVGGLMAHTQVGGEVVMVRRTVRSWPAREAAAHHTTSGDLVSPSDTAECEMSDWGVNDGVLEGGRHNLASALFHCTMAKRLTVHRTDAFLQDQDTSNVDGSSVERPLSVTKTMLWSEQEACCRQVTQIATSACGATAVINALLALNQAVDVERVVSAVGTRCRAVSAPIPRYLVSRAVAGCSAPGLLRGLQASPQLLHARHFSTWPERQLPLSHWLAYWIQLGAVPIVTLNLQSGVLDPSRTPDSWHHQMVFGVGPRGIYLTNPLECVDEGALWHHLCSDSVLLVRRKDVTSRWTSDTDLSPLLCVPGDPRWRTMNVLGQVVNIIRESQTASSTGQTRTSHVRIPACYQAGITIAALHGSEAHRRLLTAPELPILHH